MRQCQKQDWRSAITHEYEEEVDAEVAKLLSLRAEQDKPDAKAGP
jgi:hypothetical protein